MRMRRTSMMQMLQPKATHHASTTDDNSNTHNNSNRTHLRVRRTAQVIVEAQRESKTTITTKAPIAKRTEPPNRPRRNRDTNNQQH